MGFTARRLAACAFALSTFFLATAHLIPEKIQTVVRQAPQKTSNKSAKSADAKEDDFNGNYKRFFELVKKHDACPRTIVQKEAILGGSMAIIPHRSITEDGHKCEGEGELTLKSYDKSGASLISKRWDHVLQHSVINSIFKQVLESLSKYYEGSEIKGRTCGKYKHARGVSVLYTKDSAMISKAFYIDAPLGTKFMIVGAPDMLCVYIAPESNTPNTIDVGDETILVNGDEKGDKKSSRAIPTKSKAPAKTAAPVTTKTPFKKTSTHKKTTMHKTTTTKHKTTTPPATKAPSKTTTQKRKNMEVKSHTLFEKLQSAGGSFDIFIHLIQKSGASTLLKHKSRKFTVFAPSDEAFVKTAADLGHKGSSEKSAAVFLLRTFEKLALGDPMELIQKIVSYHILIGQKTKAEILRKSQLDTASGQNIHRDMKKPLVLIDHATKLPDANLVKEKLDIMCENGVIHVIDRVMFPFEVSVPMGGNGGGASNRGGSGSRGGSVKGGSAKGGSGSGGSGSGSSSSGSSSSGSSSSGSSGSSGSGSSGAGDDGSGSTSSTMGAGSGGDTGGNGSGNKGSMGEKHATSTSTSTNGSKTSSSGSGSRGGASSSSSSGSDAGKTESAGREIPKVLEGKDGSGSKGSNVSIEATVGGGSKGSHEEGSNGSQHSTTSGSEKKPFVFTIDPNSTAIASSPKPSPSLSPTPSPTATPSPLPISSASAYNVTASSPTPTPDSSATCFPADALVVLADGTEKPISDLQIGESVQTGHGEVSEVYAFTHADSNVHPIFVKLSTKYGAVSATVSHYLHIRDRGLIAAGDVVVGDALERGDGTAAVVESLSFVRSRGLYNPQTMNGNILVDGFRTSTFTTAIKPHVANALLAPLRALYRVGAAEKFLTLPYGGGRVADWVIAFKA